MSRSIAIIPARGGSKRIPSKNVIDFCGKPLIAHSIETTQKSGLFDKIHVSTDDPAIANIAAEYGVPVDFMRPSELADDFTPLAPVLRWTLQEYAQQKITFDTVCLMMPCSPLVEANDLKEAHQSFLRSEGLPVISVTEYPVPVEWAYSLDSEGALAPREQGMFASRSQDLKAHYYDIGAFYFYNTEQVLDEAFVGGGRMFPYILPRHRAIDIDEPQDIAFAELIYRGLYGSND